MNSVETAPGLTTPQLQTPAAGGPGLAPPRRRPADGDSGRSIVTLASREVYRNHWMRVREDEILRSNGEKGVYGVVEKHDSAIILPIDEGRIWLVEQFRYTIGERALELPQGGWEREIDDPEELARGELKEETGLEATGLTQTGKTPDAEEHDLILRSVPVAEFEQMMRSGEIRDNCTLSAWALYLLWKARQG